MLSDVVLAVGCCCVAIRASTRACRRVWCCPGAGGAIVLSILAQPCHHLT